MSEYVLRTFVRSQVSDNVTWTKKPSRLCKNTSSPKNVSKNELILFFVTEIIDLKKESTFNDFGEIRNNVITLNK